MTHYRLYVLGPAGRFARAVDLDCVDDGDARMQAQGRAGPDPLELWCGSRLVAKIEPLPGGLSSEGRGLGG